MNFNDLEFNAIKAEVESFLRTMSPGRAALDKPNIIFRIDEQAVEFCEIPVAWRSTTNRKNIHPFARITWNQSGNVWMLNMLSTCNTWEYYNDFLSLSDALETIRADRFSYFLD